MEDGCLTADKLVMRRQQKGWMDNSRSVFESEHRSDFWIACGWSDASSPETNPLTIFYMFSFWGKDALAL